jgi:hypothetical protein
VEGLPMELSMKSRKELTEVTAQEYRTAARGKKGLILEQFCHSTGYNRAYAAMLLRGYRRQVMVVSPSEVLTLNATKKRRYGRGRPRLYDEQVRRVVVNVWQRFGLICGKRLAPILRRCIPSIRRDRFLRPSRQVCEALQDISAATIDRLLRPARKKLRLKGTPHTRSAGALSQLIPVRTFGEFSHVAPGHAQLDTVGHDGGVATGEYAFSLALSDVCTGWTERRGVQNRASRWIEAALEEIRQAVPFPLRHLHPDNGSEFINLNVLRYCQRHGLQLSRSRAGRKNDNCWVEQKNFDTVRKLVGYARYSSPQALEALNELYRVQGLLQNYVLPSQKLLEKKRIGSKVLKHYDKPQSPAERVLAHPGITQKVKEKVRQFRRRLDPLALADEVGQLQKRLLTLADGQGPRQLHKEVR